MLPFDVRFKFNSKALKILSSKINDSLNRKFYFKVAARFWNMNELDLYKQTCEKILQLSQKAGDSQNTAKAYKFLGDYYSNKYMVELAYKNYFKAEKLYLALNDYANAARVTLEKGSLQFNSGDFLGTEKTAFQALKYVSPNSNAFVEYNSYKLLSITYCELKDFDRALKFQNSSFKYISTFANHSEERARWLNNLGYIQQRSKKYKESIKTFEMASKLRIYYDNPILYATIKENLAMSRLKTKNFANLPALLYEALKIKDSLNYYPGIIGSNLNLSEYYTLSNDIPKAIFFANRAYEIASTHNLKREMLPIIHQLVILQPGKATELLDMYSVADDSLQLADRKNANKFARIEFETDNLIQQQKQLKAENAKKDQKLMIVAGLFGLAFLLMIITYLLNRQRLRNRELAILRRQQQSESELYELRLAQQQQHDEGRQQEKKRIARELHDGVMGKLSAIRMNLFVLSRKNDPETIRKSLAHIDTLREVEQEIRDIAYDLGRKAFSEGNDFIPVVRNMLQTAEAATGMQTTLISDEKIDWQRFSNNTKMQLYRILQEAIQNIVKYAEATSIRVTLNQLGDNLRMEVHDDGKGFEKKNTRKGLGLRNMKERARELQGKLKIDSRPDFGTTITVNFPLTVK
ncbi:ATP-binding protein [Flavobacterium magnum]|uniref:ATP-binding protein n=1 Tax=Flavobacterium magnum TaxID=2162713 RepID=UPI0015E7B2A6|nr:ATP-binding protein [Flavobacterium magnum]